MALLTKQLATFTKRSMDWTGILERMIREFLEVVEIELSEAEQDVMYMLPEGLVDLVQSGVLHAIEFRAGRDGLRIEFPSDPDAEDELDMSMLRLCELSASQIEVSLVIAEPELARGLGAEMLTQLSSPKVVVSLRSETRSEPASGHEIKAYERQDSEES